MGRVVGGGTAHGRTHDHSDPSDGPLLLPRGLLPGGNLIPNGSFESGLLGWTLSAGPPFLGGGALGNVPDGKYALGFHPLGTYQWASHPLTLAPLLAGHWYCASYATLIEAGSVSASGTGVVMEGTDAVPGTITSDLGPIAGGVPKRVDVGNVQQLTWVRRWVSWQQNTDQADRYVLLTDGYGGGHTGGNIYIDAVLLAESESPSNYHGSADGGLPSGVVVGWSGTVATIPIGWLLCDGTLGTPDLRDRFIIGAAAGNENTSGGTVSASAALATHATHATHPTHASQGGHTHDSHTSATTAGPLGGASGSGSLAPQPTATHTHTVTALPVTHANQGAHQHDAHAAHDAHDAHAIEKFYRLAFIMRA